LRSEPHAAVAGETRVLAPHTQLVSRARSPVDEDDGECDRADEETADVERLGEDAAFSLILGYGATIFRGDPVVIGIGMNLLASGLTAYLLRVIFGVSGTFSDPGVVGLGRRVGRYHHGLRQASRNVTKRKARQIGCDADRRVTQKEA
jgi:hypothetical protein